MILRMKRCAPIMCALPVMLCICAGGVNAQQISRWNMEVDARQFNKNIIINLTELRSRVASVPITMRREKLSEGLSMLVDELRRDGIPERKGMVALDLVYYLDLLLKQGMDENAYTEWMHLYENRTDLSPEQVISRIRDRQSAGGD